MMSAAIVMSTCSVERQELILSQEPANERLISLTERVGVGCRLEDLVVGQSWKSPPLLFYRRADPAPVLEASHSLEERLAELQSSSPDSESLVREISGHWRRHLECLNNAECKEEGTVTVERVEASERSPHMMTPNSTPSLQDGGSPPHNHQGLEEREADEADTTLSGRLAHAEERIKALQSSLNKAQSELQELRSKYEQEMSAKAEEVGTLRTNLEKANQDPHRTTTEQVVCGWWIILSTAGTLTWWWCVSVCGAGVLSVTARLRIVHQPKLPSCWHSMVNVLWGSVLWAASCGQHPVSTDEGLEDDQHCTVQQQMSYRL
ncbi:hypothetical protein NFI96_003522 [Prochilodus magdalenae]|nr:hypothetical protein NFI96_003522 [Prochilodus magdalenae]